MRGLQLLVIVLHVVTAVALPDYPCGANLTARGEDHKFDPCVNTSAFILLHPCQGFIESNTTLPSAECCASVHDAWLQFPACFCRVTFFEHGFGGDSQPRFRARPLLCNLTADLCNLCPAYLYPQQSGIRLHTKNTAALVTIIIGVALTLVLCLSLVHWRKKIFSRNFQNDKYIEHYKSIRSIEGKPTIFPYSVLKAATNNFDPNNKLGEGGFGSVFKGVLPDGMEVAVKKLSAKSQQGNDEFLNEVTLITGVQHRNLVQLRGCCLKGQERLLVYEYLENRSLYQALFNAPVIYVLDWSTRMKILEGTARGLAYLHEGCHTRIIHRDIKASNILLDKDLNPKIADFGLARIFSENDTHVSTRVAGTAGYLAPEYAMRGQLTEKADVFSYGIVALELVSGRPNLDFHVQSYATYILDWAWQLYEEDKLIHLLDPNTTWSNDSIEEAIRVIEMALLCTHSRATLRPTMTSVVSILTGGSEVLIPKVARFDVRDYADLGFQFSDLGISPRDESGLPSSISLSSQYTDSSNVSTLEPR
ncbi:hypothetical protein M758_4G090000 [Ceratodon purpureus]|nr:hypothetical protein M758_4G090000 [Ceratodon purpureus]